MEYEMASPSASVPGCWQLIAGSSLLPDGSAEARGRGGKTLIEQRRNFVPPSLAGNDKGTDGLAVFGQRS